MNHEPPRCDIFCKVIDNFGDAAVCWRLARQLAREHGWQIRLLIDRPEVLQRLVPQSEFGTVHVEAWRATTAESWADPADMVIEAFACELPDRYVEAMARMARPPLWLNLEYLTAEAWIEDCHLMASRHPRLPLSKQFFFPGFTGRTGGLLREADYEERRNAFEPRQFRREFGLPDSDALTISLFSYPTPLLAHMFEVWAGSPEPILVLLPGSGEAQRIQGTRGVLTLMPLPFLPQQRYDELLWYCDINFVRGEDSFVRAQWAGQPLVWHIYPQEENAHEAKLDAFLQRHPGGMDMKPLWLAWNSVAGAPKLSTAWHSFRSKLPALKAAASEWQQSLGAQTDLASQLVKLYRTRLE